MLDECVIVVLRQPRDDVPPGIEKDCSEEHAVAEDGHPPGMEREINNKMKRRYVGVSFYACYILTQGV